MKQLTFLLLFLGTAAGIARAGDFSDTGTHPMYNICKTAIKVIDNNTRGTPEELQSYSYCMGYMRGLAEGLNDASQTLDFIPNLSPEALARSFVNYVNAHPGEMDEPHLLRIIGRAWTADNILMSHKAKQ